MLDVDDDATLCHVNGIFFHNLGSLDLQAKCDNKFEDSRLFSCDPFSEVRCLIAAGYILFGYHDPFQRGHRGGSERLGSASLSVGQDLEVLDSTLPA